MFARIVESTVKPEKRDELQQRVRNEILPVLQKQPGFVDSVGLVSEHDPERMWPSASGRHARMPSAITGKTSPASRMS